MQKKSRAILFINGHAEKPELLALREDDFPIAVDGGMRYLDSLGLKPDLLIGDLDSINPTLLKTLEEAQTEILRFKPQKDFTDLELALREAIARGFKEVVIAFGLGGRLDHLLGNLGLFSMAHDLAQDLKLYFDDGLTRVFFVNDELSIDLEPDDTVSLIPWRGDVLVRETHNLAYPLHNETLTFGSTRGNSNVALDKTIRVRVAKGELLLVHTRNIDLINKTFVERKDND